MIKMDEKLAELELKVWTLFYKGIAGRKKGFHFLNIGTIHDSGIQIRTVILRAVSKTDRSVSFHTDRRSRKFNALKINNGVSIHCYDSKNNIQVSLKVKCKINWKDQRAAQLYKSLNESSQTLYRKAIPPFMSIEKPISMAEDRYLSIEEGMENFVWVEAHIQQMEVLELNREIHKRAVIDYTDLRLSRWVQP